MPRLTVIIPTYNRLDLLAECLDSLKFQTYKDFGVVVVDDGSEGDVASICERHLAGARALRLDCNQGFARAINAGIRETATELVFLLNDDMTLEPDCLERLIEAHNRSNAAMIAPLVLWRDDPATIYSAGDRIRRNGRPESIGFRKARAGFTHSGPVFGVSAGAGLYMRRLFDEIGLFDEAFSAYFEDADLAFRARLAGFTAACAPEAIAYHVGSASLAGRDWERARLCCRNHALLVIKNMPLGLLARNAVPIALERLHQYRRVFSSARARFGAIRALNIVRRTGLETLALLPHALRERRRIQRSRRVAVRDIFGMVA